MKITTAALLALTLPSLAYAEAAAQRERPIRDNGGLTRETFETAAIAAFEKLDTDGSGSVNLEEYLAPQNLAFEKADRNDDGVVSAGEARGFDLDEPRGAGRSDGELTLDELNDGYEKRFNQIDKDGSGSFDQDEYVSIRLANFDKADRNNDGKLTRGELRGLEKV